MERTRIPIKTSANNQKTIISSPVEIMQWFTTVVLISSAILAVTVSIHCTVVALENYCINTCYTKDSPRVSTERSWLSKSERFGLSKRS